jgi:hypothetical protein
MANRIETPRSGARGAQRTIATGRRLSQSGQQRPGASYIFGALDVRASTINRR